MGRSAFNKKSLETAIGIGCQQYLIYASGYDTSSIGRKIQCFEIDKPEIIQDKINRLQYHNIDTSNITFIKCDFRNNDWVNNILNTSYNKSLISFNSLLGISYYYQKKSLMI